MGSGYGLSIGESNQSPYPDRSAVEVQYILRIHFYDSAGYTTSTLQLDGSIYAVCSYTAFAVHTLHRAVYLSVNAVYTPATLVY